MPPMRLRRRMSRFIRRAVKLVPSAPPGRVVGLDVQRADGVAARLAGQSRPAENRHGLAAGQADAAAVEDLRHVAAAEEARSAETRGAELAARVAGRAAEVEDAAAFEEELPLLRKEQVEPRQVELRLVGLHLREVGVVGEVRGQVLRQAVLDVDAAVAGALVHDLLRRIEGAVDRPDGVRLDLEPAVAARDLDADQGACRRQSEHAGAGRDGDAGQIGGLVLVADAAPELQAPDLVLARLEPERLERDLHLHGPAALEAARARIPDRIPVVVGVALVGDLVVEEAADGRDHEREAVAPVVEGVDADAEIVVVDDLERVALHLVGDPLRLGHPGPQPRRHVDVFVVEEHPRLGALRGGRALDRELLHEAFDGRDGLVDAVVEHTVHPQGCVEPDCTDGGAPRFVAGDDVRADGRRRSVDYHGGSRGHGAEAGRLRRC